MRQRPEPCSSPRCWFAVRQGTGSAMSWALRSRSDSPASSWGSSWGLPLSTLALDGSSTETSRGRAGMALRYADLGLLALALPAFMLAGRGIEYAAKRRAIRSLASGERRTALGTMAAATLGRVWLITLSVLVVGLVEREAGLAAAILSLALFTLYMAAKVLDRL